MILLLLFLRVCVCVCVCVCVYVCVCVWLWVFICNSICLGEWALHKGTCYELHCKNIERNRTYGIPLGALVSHFEKRKEISRKMARFSLFSIILTWQAVWFSYSDPCYVYNVPKKEIDQCLYFVPCFLKVSS
ncbi:unnamed protein product [Pipistrellus nathusii]|uniref:Secreted protein n=1 Tax=Pipistrellus nathusii TaxID=59473 RepID=A0ABN9ZQC8_PIPNA